MHAGIQPTSETSQTKRRWPNKEQKTCAHRCIEICTRQTNGEFDGKQATKGWRRSVCRFIKKIAQDMCVCMCMNVCVCMHTPNKWWICWQTNNKRMTTQLLWLHQKDSSRHVCVCVCMCVCVHTYDTRKRNVRFACKETTQRDDDVASTVSKKQLKTCVFVCMYVHTQIKSSIWLQTCNTIGRRCSLYRFKKRAHDMCVCMCVCVYVCRYTKSNRQFGCKHAIQ